MPLLKAASTFRLWRCYFHDVCFFITSIVRSPVMYELYVCLQCFDAVGWAAGRASGL